MDAYKYAEEEILATLNFKPEDLFEDEGTDSNHFWKLMQLAALTDKEAAKDAVLSYLTDRIHDLIAKEAAKIEADLDEQSRRNAHDRKFFGGKWAA